MPEVVSRRWVALKSIQESKKVSKNRHVPEGFIEEIITYNVVAISRRATRFASWWNPEVIYSRGFQIGQSILEALPVFAVIRDVPLKGLYLAFAVKSDGTFSALGNSQRLQARRSHLHHREVLRRGLFAIWALAGLTLGGWFCQWLPFAGEPTQKWRVRQPYLEMSASLVL